MISVFGEAGMKEHSPEGAGSSNESRELADFVSPILIQRQAGAILSYTLAASNLVIY